ncbi:MAG: GspE/PulE family protein [Armatimonadota bacterium]|nr:GspE/PulE family protein [Armatimonadota bacterium]
MQVLRETKAELKRLVTTPGNGKHPPLGKLLLERGLITPEQLDAALAEQRRTGELLGRILVERGYLSKQALGEALAAQKGHSYLNLTETPLDEGLVRSLPEWLVAQYRVVPVARVGDEVLLGMVDPTDVEALDVAAPHLGGRVRPVFITEADFDWAYSRFFGAEHRAARTLELLPQDSAGPAPHAAVAVVEAAEDAPTVQLLNSLLGDAIRAGATDVHLEPESEDVGVRFRVDGVLQDRLRVPHAVAASIVSRVKVLAGMDIGERVRPQDGRLLLSFGGREYDVRVATVGSAFGERMTLRLLNTRQVLLGFDRLGLEDSQRRVLERLLRRPHGMVLVTGPTGSGKTTTLYAALHHVNDRSRNIMTVEDPVEYRLPGITQIPVREKMGITFEVGLRSILRHDPDVIMVGEVRDRATASMAVHAALTGHLVLTTLHTNDAASALVRLVDLGVEPYLLASAVVAAVGQRLVRVLCRRCRRAQPADEQARRLLGVQGPAVVYGPAGCSECGGTGYRGRTGVFEILEVDTKIQDLVLRRSPASLLAEAARAAGAASLRDAAARKVLDGVTSVEEFRRVLAVEE